MRFRSSGLRGVPYPTENPPCSIGDANLTAWLDRDLLPLTTFTERTGDLEGTPSVPIPALRPRILGLLTGTIWACGT